MAHRRRRRARENPLSDTTKIAIAVGVTALVVGGGYLLYTRQQTPQLPGGGSGDGDDASAAAAAVVAVARANYERVAATPYAQAHPEFLATYKKILDDAIAAQTVAVAVKGSRSTYIDTGGRARTAHVDGTTWCRDADGNMVPC